VNLITENQYRRLCSDAYVVNACRNTNCTPDAPQTSMQAVLILRSIQFRTNKKGGLDQFNKATERSRQNRHCSQVLSAPRVWAERSLAGAEHRVDGVDQMRIFDMLYRYGRLELQYGLDGS
jgi:hypothetical protein